MMQRLIDLLRRPLSAQPAQHLRPNELRPEIVRAERLRREAMQREQAARAESARERDRQRSQSVPAPAVRQSRSTPAIVAALRSRSGLRQAILMQEILGPPRALRRPAGSGKRSESREDVP